MRDPPLDVSDADILHVVRRHWLVDAEGVEHLPVGFGAHHWVASIDDTPRLFVTLDSLGHRHTAKSLAAAYRGAAELAKRGLEFVLPPLPPLTVPVGSRIASVTHGATAQSSTRSTPCAPRTCSNASIERLLPQEFRGGRPLCRTISPSFSVTASQRPGSQGPSVTVHTPPWLRRSNTR